MGDNNTVALAALGLAGTAVAALVAMLGWATNRLSRDLQQHTRSADSQTASNKEVAKASNKQAEASQEVLDFMKNLNGKLANATIQTINEQHIGTQVVGETQVVPDRRKSDPK